MSSLHYSAPPPLVGSSSYSSSSSHIGHSNDAIDMNDVARVGYHPGSSVPNALADSDWSDGEDDLTADAQPLEAYAVQHNDVLHVQNEDPEPVEQDHPAGDMQHEQAGVDIPQQEEQAEQQVVVHNPEEGLDDDTPSKHEVLTRGQVVVRRIACTAKKIQARHAARNESNDSEAPRDESVVHIFDERCVLRASHYILPPHGRTHTRCFQGNMFVFYVIEGAVKVRVHESSFVICAGGCFMVPSGNMHRIRNLCDRDAKLFRVQAVSY
ncbi:hypothetical protein FKP32DRAFT_495729 [Trametes sanguinea]|nr:hypothetical protein FKP32DRAFT_495729 [Trametes sanguinea]